MMRYVISGALLATLVSEGMPQMRALIRILEWLRRLMCGLRGHDTVLRYEPDRLFLCCLSCGSQTVGWSLQREVNHLGATGRRVHAPRFGPVPARTLARERASPRSFISASEVRLCN
jgi:hypothetical protein